MPDRLRQALSATAIVVSLFVAAPASATERPAAPPPATKTPEGFDAYVASAMKAWETPGLSVAVVRDGKLLFAKGYGLRKQGEKAPVDADTVFAAGSISKTFTAATVAALVARDKMRWDDRVIDHLPGFRLHDPYVTNEIRLRDLLSHRSGLPRGEMLWYYSTFDRAEILRRLRHMEMEAGFRSGFGYQNLMFVAAGEAVAAATGTRWDAFVSGTFFRPLGMASTTTTVSSLGRNAATPHARVDGTFKPIGWLNVDNIAAAGGVNSSASDLAKWMQFLLADGKSGNAALLLPADIAEMQSPQTIIPVTPARRAAIPETLFRAYGLGWYLEDYRGVRLAYHGGRIDGMSARLTLVPERKLGIVVLTNRGRSSLPDALTYRLLDGYLGAPARDWSADLLKMATDHFDQQEGKRDKVLAQRVTDTSPSLPLQRYAGSYDSALYGPLDVRMEKGALRLRRNAAAVATLSHFNYDTFLARFTSPALRDRLVTFEVDKLGQVAALDFEFEARFAAVSPPLPPDLALPQPSGGKAIPTGLWTGRWNGVQPVTFAIEKTEGATASVIYAWGPAPAWNIPEGGWERHTATITGGSVVLTLPGKTIKIDNLQSQKPPEATYTEGPRKRHTDLNRVR